MSNRFKKRLVLKCGLLCINLQSETCCVIFTCCGSFSTFSKRQRGILRVWFVPSRTCRSTSPFKTLSTALCSSLMVNSIPSMSDHKDRTFKFKNLSDFSQSHLFLLSNSSKQINLEKTNHKKFYFRKKVE